MAGMLRWTGFAAILFAITGTAPSAQPNAAWRVVDMDHLGGGKAAMVCPVEDDFNVMCIAVACLKDQQAHVAYLGNGSGVSGDWYNIRFKVDGEEVGTYRFHRMQAPRGLDYYRELVPAAPRAGLIAALQNGATAEFQFMDDAFPTPGKMTLSGSKSAINAVLEGCPR